MYKLIKGHGSDQYGRPDHRSQEFYVWKDKILLGVVRKTPTAHTDRWYYRPTNGEPQYGGPVDTREDATRALDIALSMEPDRGREASTAQLGGELG